MKPCKKETIKTISYYNYQPSKVYYILRIPSSSGSERLVECELSVESVKSESVSSDSELVGKLLPLLLYPDVEATQVEATYTSIRDSTYIVAVVGELIDICASTDQPKITIGNKNTNITQKWNSKREKRIKDIHKRDEETTSIKCVITHMNVQYDNIIIIHMYVY